MLGVSYNTAWLVHQKILLAMETSESKRQLSGLIHIDDAYLGGKRSGCKRDRSSADKQAFIAAVSLQHGQPIYMKMNVIDKLDTASINTWGQTHIVKGSTIQVDACAAYRG